MSRIHWLEQFFYLEGNVISASTLGKYVFNNRDAKTTSVDETIGFEQLLVMLTWLYPKGYLRARRIPVKHLWLSFLPKKLTALHFIQKSVLWFALQIKWLVSLWKSKPLTNLAESSIIDVWMSPVCPSVIKKGRKTYMKNS